LSKTAGQNGDGGFARALTDADDDGTANAQVDPQDAQPAEEASDAPPAPRFAALNNLASLGAQLQLPTGQTAAAAAPQTAAQLLADQAAAAQALQDAAGEQVPVQTGTKPLPVAAKPSDKAGEAALAAALSGGTAAPADLITLATAVTGVKRTASAMSKPGDDEAAVATDATGDADAAAATTTAPAPVSASAEALLQLMATPAAAANATPAPTDGGPAAVAPISGKTDQADLPGDDDDTLDFLAAGNDPTDATTGKTFRFQKAGDAAVAISLSLTKGENGEAELSETKADIEKPDMVTVIDSRRYLGFGMGSNASNLLSAASGDRDWAAAMHPASSLSNAANVSSTGNVVNTLKLQLTPDHLGTVTANMRLQGDELSIHLTVHNAAAYRELSDDSKPMLEALRAQGFNVDQVTVSLSSASDPNSNSNSNSSSGQPQANSNPQAQQQQLQKDGEAARQQGQGQSSGKPGSHETENRNETAVEAPGRGGGAAGSLYL
jgi:chemotaxis protein MotD